MSCTGGMHLLGDLELLAHVLDRRASRQLHLRGPISPVFGIRVHMDKIADPEFVRSQYHTTGNLNARQALHDRFSASDLAWHDWTFSTLGVTPHCRVLDIGCGTPQP
jgi:hypothetical protein